MNQNKSLSDQELYRKCQEYGGNARMWMKKFAGLLPEVYRRHLYKRKGCASIHEFAAKLAGMSERIVDTVLRLSEKFKDKPHLLEKLETGEVGWSKLEIIAPLATKENEKDWAKKVSELPQNTLLTYARQIRLESSVDGTSQNNTEIPQDTEQWINFSFPINADIEKKLRLIKQELEKEGKTALGWNDVMTTFIQSFEENTELKKQIVGKTAKKTIITKNICEECVQKKENEREKNRETTRYIPVESKRIIQTRSRGTCEYPNCYKPGEIYHHTRRFAIKKNHDPVYIRFLCKGHEGILQMGLVENEEGMPETWKIRNEPEWWDLKNKIDQRVAEFRKEPVGQKLMPV